MKTVDQIQKWLKEDQLSIGEWGRSEISNPTDSPREIEDSKIKPNLFASTQAIYALVSTGFEDDNVFNNFFAWLNKIRDEDGYWTSAVGRSTPGVEKSFDKIKNIRHCAKGLDILLLFNKLTPEDKNIFDFVLKQQYSDGAFPQFPSGSPNIWSTAYVVNLLIRSYSDNNATKFISRSTTSEDWKVNIKTKIDQAMSWICSQLEDSLWHIPDEKNAIWATEAILAEVGGYLGHSRPDLCRTIVSKILEYPQYHREVTFWSLALVFPALNPAQQKEVIRYIKDFVKEDYKPTNVFETSCACRLFYLRENLELLSYYVHQSNFHESALVTPNKWETDTYQQWCIKMAIDKIRKGIYDLELSPKDKIDAWSTVFSIIQRIRDNIENNRGWQLLWDGGKHKDEKAFQVLFYNQMKAYAGSKGLVIREPETGRGPVDFEFNNGYKVRIYIEIKLSDNPKYIKGLKDQLTLYMKSEQIDSGIYILVGFEKDDKNKYELIKAENIKLRTDENQMFIETFYIDSSHKDSASNVKN